MPLSLSRMGRTGLRYHDRKGPARSWPLQRRSLRVRLGSRQPSTPSHDGAPLRVVYPVALLPAPAGCAARRNFDAAAEEQAIRHVIGEMETAWNRGDFPGYMQGFKN